MFTDCLSSLGVILVTVAFSMGIDAPNVQHIIHWGLLITIDEYV